MNGRKSVRRLACFLVLALVCQACSWFPPSTRQWPWDELFAGKGDPGASLFWPLPPPPPAGSDDKTQFDQLVVEREGMIQTCEPVLRYFRREKDMAWWKELGIQSSEVGFAAAAIVLATANPAANAALIGILAGIGGLEYFSMCHSCKMS